MSGKSACGDMKYAGEQLAGNFIHIGDHQKQALGGGEGGGQAAARKRTVDSGGRTRFRLHGADGHDLVEQVSASGRCKLVGLLAHWRRRSDGINSGHIAEGVSDMSGGRVPVHSFHLSHYNLHLNI